MSKQLSAAFYACIVFLVYAVASTLIYASPLLEIPGQFNLDSEEMSTRKEAKAEATFAASSDRLSSLPLDMKGKILSHLTVQEAVRASTLSSTWRYAWTDMPEVFLCDGNFSRSQFVTLVDMVLSLHIGRRCSIFQATNITMMYSSGGCSWCRGDHQVQLKSS
jgi:hypothetical protein